MTRSDFTTPEEVDEVYHRRARFYDWSVNAYYLIGFRWWAFRRRAIAALGLQPGATIVEVGCGTGLNFHLLQESIGLSGRLIGVDLCTDMLEQPATGSQLKAGVMLSSFTPAPPITIFLQASMLCFPPSRSHWNPASMK